MHEKESDRERVYRLNKERIIVSRLNNEFEYRSSNFLRSAYKERDFSNLGDLLGGLFNFLIKKVDEVSYEEVMITHKDAEVFNNMHYEILDEMNKSFSNLSISFEDFSVEYLSKKNLCLSVILVCVFTVSIKAVLGG